MGDRPARRRSRGRQHGEIAVALKIGQGATAPPFLVMDVITAANARQAALPAGAPHVLRMEVGQPGTGAPAGAVAAAQAALCEGRPMGYTEAFGLPSLRARIAAHGQAWYGVEVSPARVAVTVGASGAFPLAFLAAFDRGDRVAMATPFYPPYVNILTALGMQPVMLETGPETRFQPTVAMLEALHPRPDGLIVASPCNPAGTMLAPDELAAIAVWCHANGVRLISDEIYHGLHYDRPIATAAAFSPSAIVVNSFSKYFSMTGWRIGWLLIPDDLRDRVDALAGNLSICPPAVSQVAALGALGAGAECDAHVVRYAANRELLVDGLAAIGIDRVAPPDGAFYLYADVSHLTSDSAVWAADLLAATGVAVVPGLDFDLVDGHRFVRMCFAGDEPTIRGALAGLRRFLQR